MITKFNTQLIASKGSNIWVYGGAFDSVECSELTIEWEAGIDIREWGIKSMDFSLINITGFIATEIQTNHDEGEITEGELEISMEDFDIELDLELSNGCILPTDVEIDLDNKTIKIS